MNKNSPLLVLALCATVFSSSCAALTRYKCNREYAAKKGMEDAEAGRTSMPGKLDGNSCEGDYSPSSFSKDYSYGYELQKNEICQKNNAANYGRADGEAGNAQKPQKMKIAVCADMPAFRSMEAAYEKEFLGAFCHASRATKLATEKARAFAEPDFDTAFSACSNKTSLSKSYRAAYDSILRDSCTVSYARTAGENDAKAGAPASAVREQMKVCPSNVRDRMLSAYDSAYDSLKSQMEREAADRQAAELEKQRLVREQDFINRTTTAYFTHYQKTYTSRCNVAPDGSRVEVQVDNRYSTNVTIQGNWRVQYFNADFTKITEDQIQEAVFITPNSTKTFQKLTLPRDARYCRAEFGGYSGTGNALQPGRVGNPVKPVISPIQVGR